MRHKLSHFFFPTPNREPEKEAAERKLRQRHPIIGATQTESLFSPTLNGYPEKKKIGREETKIEKPDATEIHSVSFSTEYE